MIVNVSPKFEKSWQKLPERIKEKAKEREKAFKENPFNQSLKTHKLIGNNKEFWSFSVNYSYRIKLIFLSEKEVLFLDIGTHSIYR